MIPVQISTRLEGKAYMATLRCVVKGKERLLEVKGIGDSKDSRQRLELLTIKGSGYIKTGFQYLSAWEKADWKRANGKPVANADLWQQVAEATKIHKITIFLI